jgi:nitroimidazol reductase NimA-like FMN-containing flavoprotein (pyridoxamine 5'-phosphate oxidase superfamily)
MKIVQDTGSHFDMKDAASRALLAEMMARPLFAHLATASEDGPRESPVWFLWEDETIWIIGNRRTDSFPLRIELEPRCAIGIVNFEMVTGTVQHVGMRGRARLEPHDAKRMVRLLSRYMGEQRERWDSRFVEILDDEDYVFVRFTPESVVVRDQSYKRSDE